jgi:hypothetical protein
MEAPPRVGRSRRSADSSAVPVATELQRRGAIAGRAAAAPDQKDQVRAPLPAALDVGGADYIAPTLDLGADLSTEFLRRAHDRLEAERRQPFL